MLCLQGKQEKSMVAENMITSFILSVQSNPWTWVLVMQGIGFCFFWQRPLWAELPK